ncbi:PH domain-containing protein [Nocardioides sp. 503]|uniref:PH domain-containing protein n=1 Tax=Nocardioides sp. 503 TaxID=2508326 RepID=UPI00106F40D2|nr:PH domain-containing protein [Nocardioides sp. 503]
MSAPAPPAPPGEWQRLDPRMLLVHPVREVVRFLPPLVGLFLAGAASGGQPWQFLGIVVPVVLGLFRYLTTSFRIAAGRVELKRGLLSRHVLSTPLDRVRTVDLTASPIHRVLGLTTLRIGTGTGASGDDDDLDLDGLPVARAQELRADLLRTARAEVVAGPDGVPDDPDAPPAPERPVVELDLAWLRYAPLTTSGLVVTAGILGLGGQVLGNVDLWDEVDPTSWHVGLPGWTAVLLGLVVLAVLVVAVSVVGYLVTNWGFALTRSRGSWHLRRGLVTTRETSLDEERVAGVTVGEPLGLRLAGGGRLTAIVTGLGSASGSSTLVPPAPLAVVQRVGGAVLASTAPVTVALTGHGPAATRRRYTRAVGTAVVLAAAVASVPLLLGAPWWAVAPVLVLPLAALPLAADRARGLGHALSDGHVVARSGTLARRRDHLEVDHVIGWNLRATWFQRRVGLTSLVATTAGGPQSVTVLDVPEPLAVALADATLPHVVRQFLAPASQDPPPEGVGEGRGTARLPG